MVQFLYVRLPWSIRTKSHWLDFHSESFIGKGALNICSFPLPIKARVSRDAGCKEIKNTTIATLGGDGCIGGIVLLHLQEP